jgi:Lrp/AsnC family transcriptional regulator, leucine-responsive regulatory protein
MSEHVQLDAIDERILELLRQDARRPVSDIAASVNLSPGPVTRRISRLERSGVILGYTTVVNRARIGPSLEALAELRIRGTTRIDDIVSAVGEVAEVTEVFTLAGDPDALVRIRITDVEHLKQVINQLRQSGTFTGTKTLMVLDHWARPERSRGASR